MRTKVASLAASLIPFSCAFSACSGSPEHSDLTWYSASDIDAMNAQAKYPLLLPDRTPPGIARMGDTESFSLVGIRGGTKETSWAWNSTYESAVLGGTFVVDQRPLESSDSPCGALGSGAEKLKVPVKGVRGMAVTVCTPPGELFDTVSSQYWESVDWTQNPKYAAWLLAD